MDLSPPSLTRSPVSSPVTYCPSDRSSLEYHSPALVDPQYGIPSPYCHDQSCSAVDLDHETSLRQMDAMSHPEWTSTVLPTTSSPPIPNILSHEYDPFANYESPIPPPYNPDVYSLPPAHGQPMSEAHSPGIPATSRSPVPSSSRTSLSYHHTNGTISHPLTPRVKMESPTAFGQSLDVSHYPSPRSVNAPYVTEAGPYPPTTTASFLPDSQMAVWSKPEYPGVDSDYYQGSSDQASSSFGQDSRRQVRLSPRTRLGKTRKVTTKEEANFQCEVKGCGKYFSRSYNYKAHMETHDEKRAYPFPCGVGECNKRFVRKTDLQRHHQSVHMKEKNHKCDYCNRLFARKDTLRR